MVNWIWASVADGGPTVIQHWFNVLCFQAVFFHTGSHQTRYTDTIAGLMLARRRRRRANIYPALGQCIVFAGMCYLFLQISSRGPFCAARHPSVINGPSGNMITDKSSSGSSIEPSLIQSQRLSSGIGQTAAMSAAGWWRHNGLLGGVLKLPLNEQTQPLCPFRNWIGMRLGQIPAWHHGASCYIHCSMANLIT